MEKVKFLKVKGIKDEWDFVNVDDIDSSIDFSLYPSLEKAVAWVRMRYARDFYWAKHEAFYEDVEKHPKKNPYFNNDLIDAGDDEIHHLYWNYYLTNIIKGFEEGYIKAAAENDPPRDCDVIIVLQMNGKDFYVVLYDWNIPDNMFEFEDVTAEYYKKYVDAINPAEIEEFVNTHTEDEIEEKYAIKPGGGDMWVL